MMDNHNIPLMVRKAVHHLRSSSDRLKGVQTHALALALVVVASMAVPTNVQAVKRAVGFGVDNFEGDGECGGTDLSWSAAFAEAFADKLNDIPSYTSKAYLNKGVDGRDFTDLSKDSRGTWEAKDHVYPNGADGNKAVLISTHGNFQKDPHQFRLTMGEDHDDEPCKIKSREHMKLGNAHATDPDLDGRTRIFIAASCKGGQKAIWNDNYFDDLKDPEGLFRVFLAFHGISYDSLTDLNRLEDYLEDSVDNGLGSNWLSEMFRARTFGEDQCPVAVIWGEDKQSRDLMFDFGGFDDIKDVGDGSSATYYYLNGCDPKGGPEL